MGLGYPWADAYIENQQKEQSSMRFVYKSPKTHNFFLGINPMGLGAPWAGASLEHQQRNSIM